MTESARSNSRRALPALVVCCGALGAVTACQGTIDSGASGTMSGATTTSSGAGATTGGTGGGAATGAGGGAGVGGDTGPAYFGRPTLRRLSTVEYENSVQDVFQVESLPALELEADTRLNGLTAIGGTNLALSPRATELYEQAAYRVADALLGDEALRQSIAGCDAAQAGCAEQFLGRLGLRAFRRPLTAAELARFVGVAAQGATGLGDAWEGLSYAVAGILQSPHFLYRVELGTPSPEDARVRTLDEYELASRLSYALWSTTPDDTLLDAASLGTVNASLASHVDRLLGAPRAAGAVEGFYGEYLGLSGLATLGKLTELFPEFTDALKQAMREETVRAAADWSFASNGDFRELFTSRATYVNAELAALYGVPAPPGEGFSRVELPADGERAGLLGHASLLSLYAHESSTSATLRGKFVREVLLCQGVPAPPPTVITTLPEPGPDARTARDRLAVHSADPACGSCHALMDPIGLGLENFDAIGRYRTMENDAPIDASGQLHPDDPASVFDGPVELGTVLSQDPRVSACLVRTLYRHASGTLEQPNAEPVLAELATSFTASGHQLRELLHAMIVHPAFRVVGALD